MTHAVKLVLLVAAAVVLAPFALVAMAILPLVDLRPLETAP